MTRCRNQSDDPKEKYGSSSPWSTVQELELSNQPKSRDTESLSGRLTIRTDVNPLCISHDIGAKKK